MNKLVKTLLPFALILCPLTVRAETLNQDILYGTLLAPIPQFRGGPVLLSELLAKDNKQAETLLNEAPLLKPALTGGRAAQTLYLELNERYFGKTESRLVMTPELEILRRLKPEQTDLHSRKRGRRESPPPEWKIQQEAMQRTIQRFNLPASTTLPRLSELRSTSFRYEQALDFYQKTEARLRLTMQTPEITPPPPSPERFKAQMIEKLLNLRVLNFKASVQEGLSDWRNHSFKIEDLKTNEVRDVPIEDLASMKISIFPLASQQLSNARVSSRLPKEARSWIMRKYIKMRDGVTSYYNPSVPNEASHEDEIVQMQLADGNVIYLSIKDFKNLMSQLGPRREGDFFGAPNWMLHRFRLEGTARDVQLSNSIRFLNSVSDLTFDDLAFRLEERLKVQGFNQAAATDFLTYEIKYAGDLALQPSAAAALLWSGWAKNPAHWRIREEEASNIKVPLFNGEDVALSAKEKKKVKATARQLERVTDLRVMSDANRKADAKAYGIAHGIIWSTLAAMIYTGSHFDYSTVKDFIQNQLPQIHKSSSESGSIHWDFKGLFSLFSGGEVEGMDSSVDAENYDIPKPSQAGDGSGKPKTENDPHNPSSSPFAIEILFKRSDKFPTPVYYNFANNAHLPADILNNKRDSDEVHRIFNYRDKDVADLIIDVNVRNTMTSSGRVGLVQIKDYTVAGVDIYDWKAKEVPDDKYAVYTVPSNKQVYAQFRDKSYNGPFTFRIYYKYEPTMYKEGYLAEGFYKKSSTVLNQRLLNSGFKELQGNLESIAPDAKGKIDLGWIENTFKRSATYTFKGKTWKLNTKADAAFKTYTRFLNDGRLYYQCTGSNGLYRTYVNELAKLEHRDNQVKALPLTGFAASDFKGVKRGTPGHLHTLVVGSHESGSLYSTYYREMDATPPGDPATSPEANGDGAAFKIPPPGEEWQQLPPTILPKGQPELGRQENDARDESDESSENEVIPVSKTVSEIDVILDRLKSLNQVAWKSIELVATQETWLRNYPELTDIPGVRIIVLSHRLLKGFKEGRTPEWVYSQISNPKARQVVPLFSTHDSIQGLNVFFQEEVLNLRHQLEALDSQISNGQGAQLEFLAHDPVRSRTRELAEFLSAYAWGDLLRDYRAAANVETTTQVHINADCAKALVH